MDWILGRLACGSLADVDTLPPQVTVVLNLSQYPKNVDMPTTRQWAQYWQQLIEGYGKAPLIGGGRAPEVLQLHDCAPAPPVTVMHHEIPDEVFLDGSVWSGLTHLLSGLLTHGNTVLVHCRLGVSRAPALCAAYLMRCGMAPEEALAYVTARRAVTAVHAETWRGVLAWAEGLRHE